MLNKKIDFEQRKEETIEDFYSFDTPSGYLYTLKLLTSHYVLSYDEEDLDQAHLNRILYSAGQIGEFIVKLKEDCDRIEKESKKGAGNE